MNNYHNSVLLQQVLDNLGIYTVGIYTSGIYTSGIYTKNGDTGNISKERIYVDMTLGGGGVSLKIIENLQQGGFRKATLVSIDVDNDACLNFRKLLDKHFKNIKDMNTYILVGDVRVYIVNSNFRNIKSILSGINIESKVNGIVYDLGLSSFQIDNSDKGFSYIENSDLDMRMDKNLKVKASDLINGLYEDELYNIFKKYGEEPFSRIIAKNIIKKRKEKEIVKSDELVKIISYSVKIPLKKELESRNKAYLYHHVSRIFQALRIAVNDELGALFDSLHQVPEILEHGGRVEIISFHSLEDRIVKNFFNGSRSNEYRSGGNKEFISLYKKPIVPETMEIEKNKRARSAKLRVYEKK
ncbi:MAG: 16S rRNA (cytosine(1402)-N(4))-methyltransferase RsmH [Patescibacteria group bacterium]